MFLSTKTRLAFFLLLIPIFFHHAVGLRAETDPKLENKALPAEPAKELSVKIDGDAADKTWEQTPFKSMVSGGKEIKYKIHTDGVYVYLLAAFPSEQENRQHKLWHWDPLKQYYVAGTEQEDELYVFWSEFTSDAKPGTPPVKADVWIWRAARTDPSGHADDYSMVEKALSPESSGKSVELIPDQGVSCWTSKYYLSSSGDTAQRFQKRVPEGSASDVMSKGIWKSGFWTVEFARKLNTGYNDDINLQAAPGIRFHISTSQPDRESITFASFTGKFPAEADSK